MADTRYCSITGRKDTFVVEYAPGETYSFDLPYGLIADLEIVYRVPLLFASGVNARYARTPAAPYALFSRLDIDCNGPQMRMSPYIACGFVSKLCGESPGRAPIPMGGNSMTWEGKMRLRTRDITPIPRPATLTLTTPKSLYGPDPLLCAVTNAERQDTRLQAFWRWLRRGKPLGTGHAVTSQGGTVSVNYMFD